MLMFSAVILLG